MTENNFFAFQNETKTKQIRKRVVFSFLPIIKNKKVSWLKKTKVIERKYMSWYEILGAVCPACFYTKTRAVWKVEDIER